ncbi:hypothetical protein QYM36_015931 [Artemia franciscana]|uniref:Uncharacterized protein n=1 Tax=Artemia franciscana TaxID=6661 RepID=A0AA88HBF2_ARTSF|nr:hypothetical protein QYM36_015931 [Artemia franciscana]
MDTRIVYKIKVDLIIKKIGKGSEKQPPFLNSSYTVEKVQDKLEVSLNLIDTENFECCYRQQFYPGSLIIKEEKTVILPTWPVKTVQICLQNQAHPIEGQQVNAVNSVKMIRVVLNLQWTPMLAMRLNIQPDWSRICYDLELSDPRILVSSSEMKGLVTKTEGSLDLKCKHRDTLSISLKARGRDVEIGSGNLSIFKLLLSEGANQQMKQDVQIKRNDKSLILLPFLFTIEDKKLYRKLINLEYNHLEMRQHLERVVNKRIRV